MAKKNVNLLPKMRSGTVHQQYVRCGKKTCKCSHGELHGPYFYHFVRHHRKLKKYYLKGFEITLLLEVCSKRVADKKERSVFRKNCERRLREFREAVQRIKEIENGT